MFVKTSTHDLYVANRDASNVLVFHRGQTTPYNTYTDPTIQYTGDVTVARDGTVIASNEYKPHFTEDGSLSTWIGGPNGGTFVGNFPMTNSYSGFAVTVQKNGTVYFTDRDQSGKGALWSLSCPAGACGVQTQVAGVSFTDANGMASDNGEDLLVLDGGAANVDTFELPDPNPSIMPLLAGDPIFMALNKSDNHLFVVDDIHNEAYEYAYPSGTLIGSVPGDPGGHVAGIAIDPGHAL
jgi:hypothetical protein